MSNSNCDEQMLDTSGWSETDLRLEALRQAVAFNKSYRADDVVAAAADFYNFLNGDLVTSNIDKLEAIADILADD